MTNAKWYRIYLRSVLISHQAPRTSQPVAPLKPLKYGDYLVNAEYQSGDRLGATLVGVTVTLVLAALFVWATLGMQHREMQIIANFLGVK
jgi:hypothetical protein